MEHHGRRPRLAESHDTDYCDGTFTFQRGRMSRCSLTEIGVRYWEYLPILFDWRADVDIVPCPLRDTYQVVRNVLAACVHPDGTIAPDGGQALVVYDARNLAFRPGGNANRQWEGAKRALRRPKLLRKCSWQRLAAHMSRDRELGWLVEGLAAKYGIEPMTA